MAGTWVRVTCLGRPITSRAKATFSPTVLLLSSLKSWNTLPILRRRYGTFEPCSPLSSLPATHSCPRSGTSSRLRSLRNVDLPDPDGPTRKTNSPFSISAVASRSATTLPATDLYTLVTFSSLIMTKRWSDVGCRPRQTGGPGSALGLASQDRASPAATPAAARLCSACGPLVAKPGLDELVEVAVEHGVDVARLLLGAEVLDQ